MAKNTKKSKSVKKRTRITKPLPGWRRLPVALDVMAKKYSMEVVVIPKHHVFCAAGFTGRYCWYSAKDKVYYSIRGEHVSREEYWRYMMYLRPDKEEWILSQILGRQVVEANES